MLEHPAEAGDVSRTEADLPGPVQQRKLSVSALHAAIRSLHGKRAGRLDR